MTVMSIAQLEREAAEGEIYIKLLEDKIVEMESSRAANPKELARRIEAMSDIIDREVERVEGIYENIAIVKQAALEAKRRAAALPAPPLPPSKRHNCLRPISNSLPSPTKSTPPTSPSKARVVLPPLAFAPILKLR
eukprot:TRINITY_DN49540_c0_g1_i1.p1 TRINITY_DN49540_c0_g1~~TRINITY_DN49540_c0_g1_i1.p1  ORF type:complete len:136 (+),score=42.82 TRINITY_DN49540_c0_g1_i1:39-446(+)